MRILVKHVKPDPKTGRLIYKRKFPENLRRYVPGEKQGVKRSLGATNMTAGAAKALAAASAEYDRMAAKATKALQAAAGTFDPLDRPLIAYLSAQWLHDALEDDERVRKGLPAIVRDYAGRKDPEGDYDDSREMLVGRHGEVPHPDDPKGFDRQGIIGHWGLWVQQYAADKGHQFDPQSELFGDFCEAIAEAACEIWLEMDRRTHGAPRATPLAPAAPNAPTARKIVPLLDTFDEYAKAQAMSDGVAKEGRASLAGLIRFVGHDDVSQFTEADVRRWRDHLASEVTYRGKSRDPQTIKKRIGTLASTLRWAKEEQLLSVNVAIGVVVRIPKKQKLRDRDFTSAEARAILTASLIPAPTRMAPENRLARRWIPWLCAYTGARVGEISQLRGQDVTEVSGIWVIRITPEAGSTKDGNARIVPLHPHLIEQGFLNIVNGAGPIFYRPDRQRVQSLGNRHFKKVGEKLALWVRKDVGITDPDIQPNHGWRHTFKTAALAADMQERVSDAITGHAAKTVGQTYGSVPIKTMAEAIARMPRFEVGLTEPQAFELT